MGRERRAQSGAKRHKARDPHGDREGRETKRGAGARRLGKRMERKRMERKRRRGSRQRQGPGSWELPGTWGRRAGRWSSGRSHRQERPPTSRKTRGRRVVGGRLRPCALQPGSGDALRRSRAGIRLLSLGLPSIKRAGGSLPGRAEAGAGEPLANSDALLEDELNPHPQRGPGLHGGHPVRTDHDL